MDEIDLRILAELQRNGRLSNAELAERVGLTQSPCLRRVRQLERTGTIRGYHARLDHHALGRGFEVFVDVLMRHQDRATTAEFERELESLPDVVEVFRLFGEPDYLLRVVVSDIDTYERFHTEALSVLPGIANLTSHLVMKQVKAAGGIPLQPGNSTLH
ncbi:MAG TPA: Lrp/AsnC family transcriptional regulator [Amycolatopsis sp.]|uniref:Lrp/AsnC family transcriptional regulator n=1 Tax=Amycolatopsis sp. TaxID=37632 RepID=UPI002B48AFA6|nr:Lrp/AsnC family transcriptional regulator [Amycolatopsis sp.]HKS47435.1 Lrp/AsnC family transcriptional regulator [Amycolatopsis sp.]